VLPEKPSLLRRRARFGGLGVVTVNGSVFDSMRAIRSSSVGSLLLFFLAAATNLKTNME